MHKQDKHLERQTASDQVTNNTESKPSGHEYDLEDGSYDEQPLQHTDNTDSGYNTEPYIPPNGGGSYPYGYYQQSQYQYHPTATHIKTAGDNTNDSHKDCCCAIS